MKKLSYDFKEIGNTVKIYGEVGGIITLSKLKQQDITCYDLYFSFMVDGYKIITIRAINILCSIPTLDWFRMFIDDTIQKYYNFQ